MPKASPASQLSPVTAWVCRRRHFNLSMVHGSENHLFARLQKIRRAAHPHGASIEHMGVDHGGAHVLVPQELLDGADVLPSLQQMGGKRVSEGMAAGLLGDSGLSRRASINRRPLPYNIPTISAGSPSASLSTTGTRWRVRARTTPSSSSSLSNQSLYRNSKAASAVCEKVIHLGTTHFTRVAHPMKSQHRWRACINSRYR